MCIQPQRTMKARPKFSKTKTTWFETHIKTMGLRPKPNHHTIHITKFTAKCCFNLQQSTKIRWLLQNKQLHHSQQLLLYEILTLTTPIPESFSLSSNQSSYTANHNKPKMLLGWKNLSYKENGLHVAIHNTCR